MGWSAVESTGRNLEVVGVGSGDGYAACSDAKFILKVSRVRDGEVFEDDLM